MRKIIDSSKISVWDRWSRISGLFLLENFIFVTQTSKWRFKGCKNLNWATEKSFCRKKTCDTALESLDAVVLDCYGRQVCAHIRHIIGTHLAHTRHSVFLDFWKNEWCAFCVPHVCTYLGGLSDDKKWKVWTISFRMTCLAQKSDILSALWFQ